MTARLWQGLLLILARAGCAPELETMKASTVRVLCRQGEQISAASRCANRR